MEKRFRITVDGHAYMVTVEDLSEGNNRLYPEPGSMHVAPAQHGAAATPQGARAPAGPGDVVTPLAGVVESIAVCVGQTVALGERVATIEAMKMKTPVVAHRAGTVASIAARPGDALEAGHTLLVLG